MLDYLEYCLESLLRDWRTLAERREYIQMQERLKGKKFAERLKARYMTEWEGRK